jgi:hypothetical protein
MPHFLRIQKTALHVPSISNVIMLTSCLGRGQLRIYFHNTVKPTTLSYSNQEAWWSDYTRIKEAMKEVSGLLAKLPLTDLPVEIPKQGSEQKNQESPVEQQIKVEVEKINS